jgi:hypothetical protein
MRTRAVLRGNVGHHVDLDSELDNLYGTTPGEFVGQRNALARGLKAAGDKAAADQVARLSRPSPVAWTVNQLHFKARADLEGLRAAGRALRSAQEQQFDADDFATRRRAYQDSMKALMARALSLAAEGGLSPNAAFERRLESTLNLLGAADDVTPPPGRMSAELEPMGFDALTAAAPAPPARPKRSVPVLDQARADTIASVKSALDAVIREVRRLEHEASASEARHSRASLDADDAANRALLASRARDEARRDADEAQRRLQSARVELDEARRVYDELVSERGPV